MLTSHLSRCVTRPPAIFTCTRSPASSLRSSSSCGYLSAQDSAAKSQKPVSRHFVEDYFQEVGPLLHDVVRGEGLISGIAVPVQIGQQNLGVLYAFNKAKTSFSKPDLDTLSLLGNLAAVEIIRKRSEEKLRESEERYKKLYEESKRREDLYRSLLNSSVDSIAIYDMEGRTKYVNPAFTRIFGWTMEELEGRRIPFLPGIRTRSHYGDNLRPDSGRHSHQRI